MIGWGLCCETLGRDSENVQILRITVSWKEGGVAADSVCVTVVKELVGRHKANHFDTPGRMPCPSERILPSIHNRKARGRSVPGQGPVRQALSRSGRHENGTDVSVNEIFEPGEPHR